MRLRSAVGEREKWSGGGENRIVKRSQSATPAAEPQTEARRSCGTSRMLARDERADLRSGTGVVEGQQGDGQPVERSKPRVGHGG